MPVRIGPGAPHQTPAPHDFLRRRMTGCVQGNEMFQAAASDHRAPRSYGVETLCKGTVSDPAPAFRAGSRDTRLTAGNIFINGRNPVRILTHDEKTSWFHPGKFRSKKRRFRSFPFFAEKPRVKEKENYYNIQTTRLVFATFLSKYYTVIDLIRVAALRL